MNDEPLIYTTRGNVKIDSLRYETQWVVSDDEIVFKERYFDKADGEMVKEAAHIMILRPALMTNSDQGGFGNG